MTIDTEWWKTGFNNAYLRRLLSLYPEHGENTEVSFLIKCVPIKKEDAVLDLACGCGRHEIAFAKREYPDVTGIDYSADFIKEARKRAKSVHLPICVRRGDIRFYSAKKPFDVVLLIGNSLGYGSDRDHLRMLSNAYHNLKKKGAFVLEIPNGYRHLANRKERETWRDEKVIDGKKYIVNVFSTHKAGTNMVTSEWRVTRKENNRTNFRLKAINRYYLSGEMKEMLRRAGFRSIRTFGSWHGAKFHEKRSARLIVICKK